MRAWAIVLVPCMVLACGCQSPNAEQDELAYDYIQARAFYNLGNSLFEAGDTEGAIPYFDVVRKTCPIRSERWTIAAIKLAVCHEKRGDTELADALHREAAEWGVWSATLTSTKQTQAAHDARSECGAWRTLRRIQERDRI